MLADVPEAQRRSRARLISIADGYFDTLQLNDGTLFTEFTDDCDRVENGLQTTNNPNIEGYPIAAMGCAEQFRQGQYIYDDRLRDRRFPRWSTRRRASCLQPALSTTPDAWST